jgi:hypothetical protein
MSIGGVPADRADLKAGLGQRMQDLDEDDLEAILYAVESGMASSFYRQRAKDAMTHVTPDEARAVTCLTLETPFPVYKLLNAWLMSGGQQQQQQRDDATAAVVVVEKVGPFFALLYRGLEKLPRLRGVRAQRVVAVGNDGLPEVRAMFDGHETLCAAGAAIHFWAFASFARRDAGGDNIVLPSADNSNNANATIVYRCDALECVDVTPFFTVPRDGADGVEVLPLPPLVTTVVSAAMQPGRSKTLVMTLQQQSNDAACYVVPRVVTATPAFDKSAPLAVALLRKGLSEEQIVQDKWTALMSLPLEVVVGALTAKCSEAMLSTLARHVHASLRDNLLKLKPSSALSCELWCLVLTRFACNENGQHVLGTAAVRDALVALHPLATTATACTEWCSAICNLTTRNAANQNLFGTAAVRDTLVALHPQATTADACQWWCSAISNLARPDARKQLFGTPAVRDALVALRPQATTADACDWWCTAICNLTDKTPANQQLFGTAGVRDAFVALRPQATTAVACHWWCNAISELTGSNDANQELFGTTAVRDALVAMGAQATTVDACQAWLAAICNLVVAGADASLGSSPATRRNLQLLRVASVRKAHAALKRIASSSAMAKELWDTAALALVDDEPGVAAPAAAAQ